MALVVADSICTHVPCLHVCLRSLPPLHVATHTHTHRCTVKFLMGEEGDEKQIGDEQEYLLNLLIVNKPTYKGLIVPGGQVGTKTRAGDRADCGWMRVWSWIGGGGGGCGLVVSAATIWWMVLMPHGLCRCRGCPSRTIRST